MKTGTLSSKIRYPDEPKSPRFFILLSLLLGQCLTLSAQITPISGIVNSYYQVVEIIPAKACVRVSNPAGLSHDDRVMLVQMKGATINTNAGAATFGDTTSLNNAGNYELGTVCGVIGDSVFMVFMLLNNYTVADKVQLVRIPHYVSAIVTDTLKAARWNNLTGTGGVLAISVENDLTLNAPIYADSSGYRGGAYVLSDGTCGNSFFPPPANAFAYNGNNTNPQNGAFKGEGVADVAATVSGGKGAPANGAGGGNNHNNGGGGGANLSAGGIGGGNASTVGCTVSNPGRAGKALSSYGGKKIFAGGGGGAGHSNFNFPNPTGGGNGGGIVFIEAQNLIGNSRKISASGNRGGNAIGDGASGGGAGGTLILDIANYVGAVTIEANGAQGGTANDNGNVGRCYGAGGGGSGGVIYFSGSAPGVPTTVSGGAAGPEIGSASCNPLILPSAGTAGQIVANYSYTSSLILENSYCAEILPVELVSFKAYYRNGQAILKWRIAQPEAAAGFVVERSNDGRHWLAISALPAIENKFEYEAVDASPQPKTNFYRLRMTDIGNTINYSPIQKIFVTPAHNTFRIYPNPADKKIIVAGDMSIASEMELFDPAGRCVWRIKIPGGQPFSEIDLPRLAKGIYMLRIGEIVEKLWITR